jgi:hypothetical protein
VGTHRQQNAQGDRLEVYSRTNVCFVSDTHLEAFAIAHWSFREQGELDASAAAGVLTLTVNELMVQFFFFFEKIISHNHDPRPQTESKKWPSKQMKLSR